MGLIVKYMGKLLPCLTFVPMRRLHSPSDRGCNGMLDDITDSNPQVQEGSQVVSIRCVEFDQ